MARECTKMETPLEVCTIEDAFGISLSTIGLMVVLGKRKEV